MKTLESVEKARRAAAEAKRRLLEPRNALTPGPWEITTDSPLFAYSIRGADGVIFARVDYGRDADARAIAAVPELVAALQELIPMVEEMLPHMPQGCGWGTLATDSARAALFKTGRA